MAQADDPIDEVSGVAVPVYLTDPAYFQFLEKDHHAHRRKSFRQLIPPLDIGRQPVLRDNQLHKA